MRLRDDAGHLDRGVEVARVVGMLAQLETGDLDGRIGAAEPVQPKPAPVCVEPVKLRCVGIKPRLLSLVDLERGDCRYPYGGDREGEAIAFCGHPTREGSSYCTAHFHLTRGPGTASERSAGPVMLRLVEAA